MDRLEKSFFCKIKYFLGGIGIWVAATYAFITDISRPDQAAFRLGMLHVASKIAGPIGPPIGAAIFEKGTLSRYKVDIY